jgi:hypothetical protein
MGLLVLLLGGTAGAAPVYTFAFEQSNYEVVPGGTVEVRVFLRETLGVGDVSLLATEGLFSAGVRVRFDDPPLPSSPSEVQTTADILGNPAFDFRFGPSKFLTPGSNAALLESLDLATHEGVKGTGGPTTFQVLLGAFRFTGGLLDAETTLVRATRFSPMSREIITNGTGTVLDPLVSDGRTTVGTHGPSVVPEPDSMVLLVIGVLGMAVYGWRCRRGVG